MKPNAPFERHLASPTALENRAQELADLAGEATDQQVITDQAFRPAVAAWDGLAAPELQQVPEPARKQAQDAAAELAWAAVPLRFWADQVRQFNSIVDDLRERRSGVTGEAARLTREHFGDSYDQMPEFMVETVLGQKRNQLIHELERQWQDAFDTYVDEGERTAAGMFSNGPSWENLQLAQEHGAIGDGALMTFFAAQWDRSAAVAEADRIAAVINDPSREPTREELERFAQLLAQYQDDEEFAYLLMTQLGPDGLIGVYGNVALLQPDGSYHGFDRELAELQAAIQTGLATTLATATTRRGTGGTHQYDPYQPGEWELPSSWLVELALAGREQHELVRVDPSLGNIPVSLYGYQLVGAMLSASEVPFDTAFLRLIGSDMIDFEMESDWSMYGDGLPIWYDSWNGANNPGAGHTPFRLNWVDGFDGDAPAGFDPMHGLMRALADDPEAARQVFTSRVLYDGTEGGRLPRLDHLLTERTWFPDVAGHYFWEDAPQHYYPTDWGVDWSGPNPGQALLGEVLEAAIVGNADHPADDRSVRMIESMVYELNNDWPHPYRDELIPVAMRDSVANIMADYVIDVNNAIGDYPLFDGRGAEFQETHLTRVLEHIGRHDDDAQQTMREAQHSHTLQSLNYYLSGEFDNDTILSERFNRVEQVTIGHGRVLAAMDVGLVENTQLQEEERLNALLRRQEQDRAIVEKVVNGSLNIGLAIAPTPGVADTVIKMAVSEAMGAVPDPSLSPEQLNELAESNERLREELNVTARGVQELVEHAAYASAPLNDLPPEFIDDRTGERIPPEQWDSTMERQWRDYLNDTRDGNLVQEGASNARRSYEHSYSYQVSLP